MKIAKPAQQIDFPSIEKKWIEIWKDHDTFRQSVEGETETGAKRVPWAFYDGPPFATGLPHYGHLLASIIKDVVPRYQTMKGKCVVRRFGWDCHGLPVEFEMEKKLGLKGRQDIVAYGVSEFNEACRSIVLRYATEWEQTIGRVGRWIDFKNDYKTMNPEFMESVWFIFKQLWDRGLIYEDKKVLPYSTAVASPLSNFEANLNYQDAQDPSVYVKLRVANETNKFLVIWTTTPWTLPANMAVAVHPDELYAEFENTKTGEIYIGHQSLFAKILTEKLKLKKDDWKIKSQRQGKDLAGTRYENLFGFPDHVNLKNAHQVVTADYVTTDTGTGLVHIAPAYGEDDYEVGKKYFLDVPDHLDDQGVFLNNAAIAAGKYFKDADKDIIADLKTRRLILHQETLMHSYPFCYRSDTPLLYRAISTWFVAVTRIREQLLMNNDQISWVPSHLKDGRFGKWLDGARDWAISRNRFWGNPIPIWRNEETGESLCIGSRAELERMTGTEIPDLHKHKIDGLQIKSPTTGAMLTRVPHVLDCWFESGSMPFAQIHYPFSVSEEDLTKQFPAEFIAEGLDQTRGWFYTLLVLSTALNKGPAFKNVVVNGIILAQDGRKMSKRLQNYPDPMEVLEKYGADALRLYLLQTPAMHGDDVRFQEAMLPETIRKIMLPLWNAYSFFATYAAIDGFDPTSDKNGFVNASNRTHTLDQWIFVKISRCATEVEKHMTSYELAKVMSPIIMFLDDLNNWYIRRSRRRFWKSESDDDKREAYSTLYEVLIGFVKILAPFAPFISEELYEKLNLGHPLTKATSVHLASFPQYSTQFNETQLSIEKSQDMIRNLVSMGRDLREKVKIKTRQPLQRAIVGGVTENDFVRDDLQSLKMELNVKEIVFDAAENMAIYKIKPNFKTLGKLLGPKMKAFQARTATLTATEIKKISESDTFDFEGIKIDKNALEFVVETKSDYAFPSQAGHGLVIALDTQLDEVLKLEGLAREWVHALQEARKDAGYDVEDRIHGVLLYAPDDETQKAFKSHESWIRTETLMPDSKMIQSVEDASETWKRLNVGATTCLVHLPK